MKEIIVIFMVIVLNPIERAYGDFNPFEIQIVDQQRNESRSLFWPQFSSILLPGFDQWWEGQNDSALFYTGMASLGFGVARYSTLQYLKKVESEEDVVNVEDPSDFDELDDHLKWTVWGSQFYQTMGSLSAYHSFRTAVKSRQAQGEFSFLKKEETTKDILLAPFDFSLLKKPTSYIPLGTLFILTTLALNDPEYGSSKQMSMGEFTFGGAISYNAGTGEEAVFRGWLMPLFREQTGSDVWSNVFASTLFGVAHLTPQNKAPVIQTVFGYYLGWLTQENDWTLKESVFIHTWWDVIAFTFQFLSLDRDEEAFIYLPLATISF